MPGARLGLVSVVNESIEVLCIVNTNRRRQQNIKKIIGVMIRESIATTGALVPSSSDLNLVPPSMPSKTNGTMNRKNEASRMIWIAIAIEVQSIRDVGTACGGNILA